MNILLVSPLELKVGGKVQGYAGLEELVRQYANELSKEHKVTVMGHQDSVYSPSVIHLKASPGHDGEVKAFQEYQSTYRQVDIIHDWSHLHLGARFMPNLPIISGVHHAPLYARYPKAPYNIVIWSQYGVREFRRVYNQEARFLEMITLDAELYKPDMPRGDRFLTLGVMREDKGNLDCIRLCKLLGLKLDVAGGRGSEHTAGSPPDEYEQAIQDECDGEQIKFYGEVDLPTKLQLMKTCKALLYITNHQELTSHKIQEAQLAGAPVVVPGLGGIPEFITQGVDGYLCLTEQDYIEGIKNVDRLEPAKTRPALAERYNIKTRLKDFLGMYEKVAKGERW